MEEFTGNRHRILRKLILIIISVIFIAGLFNFTGLFKSFELQVFDTLIRWRQYADTSKDLVLINVDDQTSDSLGWPLPRTYYAQIIEQVNAAGAELILLDFMFLDLRIPREDSILAHTVARAGNVINVFDLPIPKENYQPDDRDCSENPWSRYAYHSPELTQNDIHFPVAFEEDFPNNYFLNYFDKAGHITVIEDADRHVRKISPLISFEGCHFPAAGFLTICEYLNARPENTHLQKSWFCDKLVIEGYSDTLALPINRAGQFLLNYYDDFNAFQVFSVLDVLDSLVSRDVFRDKIIVMGSTMAGDCDVFSIPYNASFPGVGMHATLISNILQNNLIQEIPFWLNFLISLTLSLLMLANPFRKNPGIPYHFFFPLFFIAILGGIAFYLLNSPAECWWLKVTQISAAILMSFLVITIYEKLEIHQKNIRISEELTKSQSIIFQKDKELSRLEELLNLTRKQAETFQILQKDLNSFLQPELQVNQLTDLTEQNIKMRETLQEQLQKNEKFITEIRAEKLREQEHVSELLSEKGEIEPREIGNCQELEIFVARREISIKGTKGRSKQIPFTNVYMAFIYYLAQARLQNEIWVQQRLITNMDAALEASNQFGYDRIIGCTYEGQRNFLSVHRLAQKDYLPDPQRVPKYASYINKMVKKYVKTPRSFIHTPQKKQNGEYFLNEGITSILIHEK